MKAIQAADARHRGLIADVLYERDTPLSLRIAAKLLDVEHLRRPHVWRYAKSVLKRAMIREDAKMFARLAYRIERASIGYAGETASVKSGLDGEKRTMRIFGPKTQRWVRRACWRYLRDLARYRPEKYVDAAAHILSHYRPEDAGVAKKGYGTFADAFLLHRILHARSDRYVVRWRTLRHEHASAKAVEKPEGMREEAFPTLWDGRPEAFLRLLARARFREVQDFALDGLVRHPEVLRSAKIARLLDVVALSRLEATVLVTQELERRFEEAIASGDPGWSLIEAVLAHPHDDLSSTVVRWLERSAQAWTGSIERIVAVMEASDRKVRMRAVPIAASYLRTAAPRFRSELASRVLERLRDGDHAELAMLARDALAEELASMLDVDALLGLIRDGSNSAKQLAGHLLGRRKDALEVIGLPGLMALTDHEIAAVRAAGHAILRGAALRDPSPLFALAESQWEDTQKLAFELLRAFPLASLGLDGVISLCDSTQPAVSELGRELVVRHFAELDAEQVLFRLSEHPSQAMRRYALELIEAHLRPGAVPLMRLEAFFRACLFDMRPRRELKHGLLAFLAARGLADERQGEHVAALLADVLRTHTRSDFDRVSETLARVQVAHPEVHTDLRLFLEAE
jgi:hypothetical protein